MSVSVPDRDMGRDADLAGRRAFLLAYQEAILRAPRILRVPDEEIDDLADSFLLGAAGPRSSDTVRGFRAQEARERRPARFRTFLDHSLQEHVRGHYAGSVARIGEWGTDHPVPEAVARLPYTIVNVVAMVRCRAELHTSGAGSLAGNIRWFLARRWLDDRLRPLFDIGLARLEGCPVPGPEVAPGTGPGPRSRRADRP